MTEDEITVLRMALENEGRIRWRAVFNIMGESRSYRIFKQLQGAGALEHPAYDDWRITEKGRIAIALASVKRP